MHVRPTVRVLLVDPERRLLLFASAASSVPGKTVWFAVGGGVEPGETPEQAAIREVREETGLDALVLGQHIWNRRHVLADNTGDIVDLREAYYVAHVPSFEIDTSGFTAAETAYVTRWRWWTLTELEQTADLLAPRDLPALFRDLLVDGPPRAPRTVGV